MIRSQKLQPLQRGPARQCCWQGGRQ